MRHGTAVLYAQNLHGLPGLEPRRHLQKVAVVDGVAIHA